MIIENAKGQRIGTLVQVQKNAGSPEDSWFIYNENDHVAVTIRDAAGIKEATELFVNGKLAGSMGKPKPRKEDNAYKVTPTVANEVRFAIETAEDSGRDAGMTVDKNVVTVTDVNLAWWALEGVRDIHADNAAMETGAEKQKAKRLADGLTKLMSEMNKAKPAEPKRMVDVDGNELAVGDVTFDGSGRRGRISKINDDGTVITSATQANGTAKYRTHKPEDLKKVMPTGPWNNDATVTYGNMKAAPEGSKITVRHPGKGSIILTKRGDRWHKGTADTTGTSHDKLLELIEKEKAKNPEVTVAFGDRTPGPFDNGGTLPGGKPEVTNVRVGKTDVTVGDTVEVRTRDFTAPGQPEVWKRGKVSKITTDDDNGLSDIMVMGEDGNLLPVTRVGKRGGGTAAIRPLAAKRDRNKEATDFVALNRGKKFKRVTNGVEQPGTWTPVSVNRGGQGEYVTVRDEAMNVTVDVFPDDLKPDTSSDVDNRIADSVRRANMVKLGEMARDTSPGMERAAEAAKAELARRRAVQRDQMANTDDIQKQNTEQHFATITDIMARMPGNRKIKRELITKIENPRRGAYKVFTSGGQVMTFFDRSQPDGSTRLNGRVFSGYVGDNGSGMLIPDDGGNDPDAAQWRKFVEVAQSHMTRDQINDVRRKKAEAAKVRQVEESARMESVRLQEMQQMARQKAEERERLFGDRFDLSGLTPAQEGRLRKHMERTTRYDGGVLTNAEFYALPEWNSKYHSTYNGKPWYAVRNAQGMQVEIPKMVFDALRLPDASKGE